MRLAQKFVPIAVFVSKVKTSNGPMERRGTIIIDGEKHNRQGKFKLRVAREASCPGGLRIFANGPAVEGVNVGGAVRRYVSWFFSHEVVPAASHHGAIFASPGDRRICLGCGICSEPKSRICQMSDKLSFTIKLSRWRAKIVTSLLPQPSVLAHVLMLNLSRYYQSV